MTALQQRSFVRVTKRRLGCSARLAIVARLLESGLVSEDEAKKLGSSHKSVRKMLRACKEITCATRSLIEGGSCNSIRRGNHHA